MADWFTGPLTVGAMDAAIASLQRLLTDDRAWA
jgi:hypothetical protein